MNNIEYQAGDIFLCDSNRIGAKIVKFLMTAPTIWQYMWRAIRGTQQEVFYYHAGMMVNSIQLIEQQGKVQVDAADKISNRDVVVYRMKNILPQTQGLLYARAMEDLGKGYDVPLIFGKTLTWLTGIKFFTDFLGWISHNEEICVTRVAKWYQGIEDFGVKDHSEVTTKIMDEYCKNSPKWEIVYGHE